MTDLELEVIEERANAATPGPWIEVKKSVRVLTNFSPKGKAPSGYEGGICNCLGCYRPGIDRQSDLNLQAAANAEFIAHAREDVPELIEDIRILRSELKRAIETLNRLLDDTARFYEDGSIIDDSRIDAWQVIEDSWAL